MRNVVLILLLLCVPALADRVDRFIDAAEDGDIAGMERWYVRVDSRDEDGETALIEAAEAGQLEAVRWLLDHGARPNLQDLEGETALLEAAEEGRVQVMRLLLDRGARIDHHDLRGRTPLMAAVQGGHLEAVALLLDRGAAVGAIDHRGRTAVDMAADKPEILALLKRRGG